MEGTTMTALSQLSTSNMSVNDSENVTTSAPTTQNQNAGLKLAFDIVVNITLIGIMSGMGSTIELKTLKQHLKRPVGIAIGMFSQFIVLPATVFGISHALQLPDWPALGLLVLSCCPGGPISNIYAYWLDGDVALSMAMTTCSVILCAGMLPLNLFIYSRSWTEDTLVIPYINIFYAFLMAFCPTAVGVFLRWKWPKVAAVVVKVGNVSGAVCIVALLVLISLLYPFIYTSPFEIYAAATLMSVCGFIFGYIVASICRMSHSKRRTVSLETGVQNFPLCMAMLSLTFEGEQFIGMVVMPLLYAITVLCTTFLYLVLYKLHVQLNKCLGKSNKQDIADLKTVETKEDSNDK